MDKQIIVITDAELRGMKHGQGVVTEIAQGMDMIEKTVQGIDGYIVGLIDNIADGRPVTEEQLQHLFNNYVGRVRTLNLTCRENARILWRHMQDEENEARQADETARGVN